MTAGAAWALQGRAGLVRIDGSTFSTERIPLEHRADWTAVRDGRLFVAGGTMQNSSQVTEIDARGVVLGATDVDYRISREAIVNGQEGFMTRARLFYGFGAGLISVPSVLTGSEFQNRFVSLDAAIWMVDHNQGRLVRLDAFGPGPDEVSLRLGDLLVPRVPDSRPIGPAWSAVPSSPSGIAGASAFGVAWWTGTELVLWGEVKREHLGKAGAAWNPETGAWRRAGAGNYENSRWSIRRDRRWFRRLGWVRCVTIPPVD